MHFLTCPGTFPFIDATVLPALRRHHSKYCASAAAWENT